MVTSFEMGCEISEQA